jgi:hypothetical protein
MSLPQFTYYLVALGGFLTSAIVCVLASQAYRVTHKRGVLWVAIAGGLGAVISGLPALGGAPAPWAFWYFVMALRLADGVLWLVGCWLLLRDYVSLLRLGAGAAPSDGWPAAPAANPGPPKQPPSLS